MSRVIQMQVRKNSYTATDWKEAPLPDYGKYGPMPQWRRLGNSRQFAASFRVTDPVDVTIVALQIELD